MKEKLIDLFGAAVKEVNNLSARDINRIQTLSIQTGYIIHPDCYNYTVLRWLLGKNINLNSTFYKTWQDVTEKSRFELYIDQITSYAINYGLNGNFDMNDHDYSMVPDIRKYKLITPITKEEMFDKCKNLVYKNIAMDQITIEAVCDYIAENYIEQNFDIDNVNVREAQVILCDKLNIFPKDKFSLLRYLVYKSTHSSELIKSKQMINRIKVGVCSLNNLAEEDLIKLSSIFYRFKPIFLAFKSQSPSNAKVINKIRRLAKKYHQPMKIGFWESVINTPMSEKSLKERLAADKPSSFKLITLIQTIRENRMLIGSETRYKLYRIRNNNIWVDNIGIPPALDIKYNWWDVLDTVLYNELVDRLKSKACAVKFNTDLKLACPTSEKDFIGNIPFGSYYHMKKNNMVGIYWKEEWGTRDFDLSFVDYNGTKYGWNARFYDEADQTSKIIYSGDMTSANPEASEVIYISSDCPNGIFKVNRYSGVDGSKYILSIAQSKVSKLSKNYMIDPNTIKFQTEILSDKREQVVGFVVDGYLYISKYDLADVQISKSFGTKEIIDILRRKTAARIDLEQLLIDAGFKPMVRGSKTNPIELDLTELNKDTLINLFS